MKIYHFEAVSICYVIDNLYMTNDVACVFIYKGVEFLKVFYIDLGGGEGQRVSSSQGIEMNKIHTYTHVCCCIRAHLELIICTYTKMMTLVIVIC